MSIFYLNVRNVSKAKQSAVAKASYVSNEKLYSERDEETKSYRSRSVKPDSFILAPVHAPQWVYNREELWNNVEKVEKNYNARLLKEIVVALPIELSNEEQKELLIDYVQETLVADGMVADVNIHRDQLHNPHAHILLTVRPFNPDGTWWETKSKKEYKLDSEGNHLFNEKGNKISYKVDLTGWESKETLLNWRKSFAEKTNEHFKKLGIQEEVSHLSYEEQGIEKLGKQRLTRNEYHVENNAKEVALQNGVEYEPVTYYGSMNLVIEQYNKEIEMIDNKIVSLDEYRNRKEPFEVQVFENIRKNAKWFNGAYEATKFVKERSKSNYVDYQTTRKTMDSLEHWKLSIDKKYRSLERERKVLETAKSHYEKGSKDLNRLGFASNDFVSQYNPKVEILDKKYKQLSDEFARYNESFAYTEKAHNFQTHLLREEFIYLYPKYDSITEISSREIEDIMYEKVTSFKDDKQLLKSLPEFERSELYGTKEEQEFRAIISESVVDYRNYSKQYFALSKRLSNENSLYVDVVKSHKDLVVHSDESKQIIYDAAVTYLTSKHEMDHLSNKYDQTKNQMFNALIELYGEEQKPVIEKLPDRIKVLLLESYLREPVVGELKDDLAEVKWKVHEQGLEKKWKDNNEEFTPFETQNASGKAVGNLLSDLIQQAQQNEGMTHDLEQRRKRAKRKNKKLTKEEMEHGS